MSSTQEHKSAQTGLVNININKKTDDSDKSRSAKRRRKDAEDQLAKIYGPLNLDELKPLAKAAVEELGGYIPGLGRASRDCLIHIIEHCKDVIQQRALKKEKKANESPKPKKKVAKKSKKADKEKPKEVEADQSGKPADSEQSKEQ
jgi:hypothetical protein